MNVIDKLVSEGIYIFPEPFATQEQVEKIISLTEDKLDPDDGSYEFGRAGRIGPIEDWIGTTVHDIFSRPSLWALASIFMEKEMDTAPFFNELFVTHDYRSDQGLARNGELHFDRIETFKFFMYLTDCDRDSGAFRYVPESYQIGKKLRVEARDNISEYEKIKNRLELAYPKLGYTFADSIPVEGPAGTIIAFHSDVFHVGGHVADGKERRVIRLHLRGE